MGQYSIKDVETLSGVKAHTLRIWETRYDFLKPDRTDTNIRYYSDEQLKLILNVSSLIRTGMRISKIASLDGPQLCNEVEKLSLKDGQPDALLNALIHSMIEFDEGRFEKTLSCAIMKMGIERTFMELVFPLLIRTGVLWSIGTIHPAQEHFMSNLIRRKLCVAIDNQFVEKNPQAKRFALFLPEGETHELLLLFTEFLLRQRHHQVAYIGSSIPFNDIAFIDKTFNPDYFITYFSISPEEMPLQDYIDKLAFSFPEKRMIIGGKQLDIQKPQQPINTCFVRNLDDLLVVLNP